MKQRWSVFATALLGILIASVYGFGIRWLAESDQLIGVMSVALLFGVPAVMGVVSLLPVRDPTLAQALALPTVSVGIMIGATKVAGLEGLICIAMAFIPALVIAAVAGLITFAIRCYRKRVRLAKLAAEREAFHNGDKDLYVMMVLPLLLALGESQFDAPLDHRVVHGEIMIAASPEAVWTEIVEVRPIEEHEHRPALFTSIGFPRPISALVDRREVGGVREARFEGGVLFLERITRFEPGLALEFTIDAQEHLIPPTTLDPHVTIGGPYFDVLMGRYEIEPCEGGVILHLTSDLRVSTTFNFYASQWADVVMASIQDNILAIIKDRAES